MNECIVHMGPLGGDYCGPQCDRDTAYWNRPHRPFYRFVGRSTNGNSYIWEGPEVGDGRVELVTCDVAYFWRNSPGTVIKART